jgi:hypothetical protein
MAIPPATALNGLAQALDRQIAAGVMSNLTISNCTLMGADGVAITTRPADVIKFGKPSFREELQAEVDEWLPELT